MFDDGKVKIYKENNIVFFEYVNVSSLDVTAAKYYLEERYKVTQSQDSLPLVVIIHKFVKLDYEANKLLKSEAGVRFVSKCAIVFTNPVAQIITSIFLKVDKPCVPTKAFTASNKEKTISWVSEVEELA